MPIERITFRPGINKQATPTLNEGGWSDGNLVRFRDGLPQPIGGWVRTLATPFQGVCRMLHAWATLASARLVALGTSAALYVADGDTLNDITPAGLAPGQASNSYGMGWGSGPWGAGTYGTSRSGLVVTGDLRLWSLDHWGEDLVACIRGGGMYAWAPTGGFGVKAAAIPGAPAVSGSILVGMPERHLIAFGSSAGAAYDPLLVRWSDVEDRTSWIATATNSAGSYRIVGGSEIRAGLASTQEILIWTDTVLYAMRFQGLPYVYGFFLIATGCGVIAPGAAVVMGGVAYWMGMQGFYRYAGQVQPIPCTVWDTVFRDLTPRQQAKIVAGANSGFNEVWWFFPSADAVENDSYVVLNVVTGEWTSGKLSRTAWIDAVRFGFPLACGPDGQLYTHEFGTDADGAGLPAFVESGYVDLAAGQEFMILDQLIPDFRDHAGPVWITLKAQAEPNGPVKAKGPFAVTPTTRLRSPRLRGRQMAVRIESNTPGAFWRLGALRLRIAPDGRK